MIERREQESRWKTATAGYWDLDRHRLQWRAKQVSGDLGLRLGVGVLRNLRDDTERHQAQVD
jgi:hypothetical protein